MRMRMFVHAELGSGQSGLDHPIDRHVPPFDGKAAERALQLVERQAGIEQRAENHVARRARETVEVQNPQSNPSALKLKNVAPPRMMWSINVIPITSPASRRRRVINRSATLGDGSPDGWL